jgi:hypothetical protein
MMPDNTMMVETRCSKCGTPIQTFSETDLDMEMEVKIAGKYGFYDRKVVKPFKGFKSFVLCNSCADKRLAELDSVQAKSRAQQWSELCPPAYRATEAYRLPSPTKLERVMRWNYGAKGLALIGPTGRGKSRCAWKLMEREFFAGRSVECLDAKFAMEYAGKMNLGASIAIEWIGGKMNAALLLLDDTLKVKLENSGAETALFAVIEERMANNRPIILTTQDTGETLRSRMSSDRGEATVRRLRECCEVITFD